MDWSEVTRRVVVEAASPHPSDVVWCLGGDAGVVEALAPRVAQVIVRAPAPLAALPANARQELRPVGVDAPPAGVSVVVLHDELRRRPKPEQRAMLKALGALLPARALLVVGDVLWSMPPASIDEPEQFGDALQHAPTVSELEGWVRDAGFLPDTHRFGVGRAVLIALRTG